MRTRSASSHFAPTAAAAAAARPSVGASEPSTLLALAKQNALVSTRVPKFLRSLYDILYNEDPSILAWAPDGTFFQILDTRRLEAAVLPKYFKHSKFASFQRQLNNFGFRKWTKTQSSVCTFSHQHLVRCHPLHLAELISRHATSPPKQSSATDAPRSPAGHKRPLDTTDSDDADSSAASTESRISPRSAKLIKREPVSFGCETDKFSSVETHVGASQWDPNRVQCWSLDPALFQKPDAVASAQAMANNRCAEKPSGFTPMPTDLSNAFSFSLDDLNDLMLSAPDAYERTFELRMLNECLDLAPPSSSSFVGLLTGNGDLPSSAMASYSWSDFGRSDVAL